MNVDWKRKLTSRKFWAAAAGFIAGIVIYVQNPEKSPEAVSGIIMSLGAVVSYIIGEGLADQSGERRTESGEQGKEGGGDGISDAG